MKKILFIFLIIPLSAFADELFMSNIPNGCANSLNQHTFLTATFTRNQYQCNTGYYVPANTDHCVICPDVYDCNGGTFTFNEEIDQGNKFKTQITGNIANGCQGDFLRAYNNAANITATFTPNVHTCNPGYYLPANIDECTLCPANSYCPGGTYTFNETDDQGILECPTGTFAPVGSSGCYAHKLHIGDEFMYLRSTKLTTPSLNIAYDDKVFYANTTTSPTPITAGSTQYLKVMYNNTEYYICDDFSYTE